MGLTDDVLTVPGWDELIAVFLSWIARGIFGTGAGFTTVVVLLSTVMVVRGVIDAYRDARNTGRKVGQLAVGAVAWGRGATNLIRAALRRKTPITVAFNVAITVVLMSLQGLWLVASWAISDQVTELLNAYTGDAKPLAVGVPWKSFTGYYTIVCAALLFVAWLVRGLHATLASWAIVVPVVAGVPLFVILLLGTPLNLVSSLFTWPQLGSEAWSQWDALGELWLYLGIIAAYCAITYAAMKLADYGTRRWAE